MEIRGLTQSLDIIAQLVDEPNDEGGLSSAELKAKFDEGGNVIRGYINETLIPDVSNAIEQSVSSAVIAQGNMPKGGKAGQMLIKKSDTDFDAGYENAPVGLPRGGLEGQLLSKQSDDDFDIGFLSVGDIVTASDMVTGAGVKLGLGQEASVEQTLTALAQAALLCGTCSTAAATAAKVVTIPGFTRSTGAIVEVTFTATNTASSPTLNVSDTGAAAIRYANAALSSPGQLTARVPHLFLYDGSFWQLLNPYVSKDYVVGAYTGNGAVSRTISLGFMPSGVLQIGSNLASSLGWYSIGLATLGAASYTDGINIMSVVSNGFSVGRVAGHREDIYFNGSGQVYNYIAWR